MSAVPATTPFAAVLLAGGQSSRMGRDKAWMDWRGRPLWAVQLAKLRELCPTRLIVACREEQRVSSPHAETLHDPPDNQGPLPALARCLDHARMPLLTLAVDMPGITVELLRGVIQHGVETTSGVVFRGAHGYEPLCALYPIAALPLLRESLAQGNLRLQTFAQSLVEAGLLRVIPLSKEREALFFNLNSPADLA